MITVGSENGGRERGGGGFAVGAGNGHALPQAHELGQHFRTGDNGDIAPTGLHQFRVVLTDGRGFNQHLHIADIFRRVAQSDVRAQIPQMAHHGRIGHIRPRDRVPLVKQHFRNAAHARAADAHHVDAFDFVVHVKNPLKKV